MICFLFPSMDLDNITLVRVFPLELVKTIFVVFTMSLGVGFSSTIFAISIPVCPHTEDIKSVSRIIFTVFPSQSIFLLIILLKQPVLLMYLMKLKPLQKPSNHQCIVWGQMRKIVKHQSPYLMLHQV